MHALREPAGKKKSAPAENIRRGSVLRIFEFSPVPQQKFRRLDTKQRKRRRKPKNIEPKPSHHDRDNYRISRNKIATQVYFSPYDPQKAAQNKKCSDSSDMEFYVRPESAPKEIIPRACLVFFRKRDNHPPADRQERRK